MAPEPNHRWLKSAVRTTALLVALASLFGAPSPRAATTWVPPIGIPVPPFGIEEVAPSPPRNWSSPVAKFYYVEASAPNATDAGNPLGSPRQPRASVPQSLPAGSVVEIRGVYDRGHTNPNVIMANGTAAEPVFIRGDPEHPAEITRPWAVAGTYFIVEYLHFKDRDGFISGSFQIVPPTTRGAIRHSEVSGNLKAGGLGLEGWRGSVSTEVVAYNNKIHDNGDVNANFDQDRHGIHVGEYINQVWVVDNEMWRNSGDGIQINAGNNSLQNFTHHIYVGRNVAHHNKQYGFWTKQARDVIFSQNVAYAHRPSNSSLGAGLGFQYATDYVWFLFNHVYDSDFGIQAASDSRLGSGKESFIIGNLIHDIHDSDNDFKPNTAWHNCGISLSGGTNRYVINNTIINADSGICSPSVNGKLIIYNNLVFGARANGQSLFIEMTPLARATRGVGNIFGPVYQSRIASATERTEGDRLGTNSVVKNPGLALTQPDPYDLLPSSPAVNRGSADIAPIYGLFKTRYGIDINVDYLGRPRPIGENYDVGAFEWQSKPILAPGNN
jgi:hypothetical protein